MTSHRKNKKKTKRAEGQGTKLKSINPNKWQGSHLPGNMNSMFNVTTKMTSS
uniref:Uncharacterized protein n=1 Tax=Rhizophora mucronata TaxID=61149 RepID=A0A2P2QLI4_RHIMU